MDQAISIMGQKGIAKLVEFNPVRPASLCEQGRGGCSCVARSARLSGYGRASAQGLQQQAAPAGLRQPLT